MMTHIITTAVTAFLFTSVLGIWLIPYLRKIKYGQTIREDGPKWHRNKQGTPTMGGIMFILGIIVAVIAGFAIYIGNNPSATANANFINIVRLWAGIVMACAFGFIGFIDDYIKVVKKRNLGLTASQKTIMQILVSVMYLGSLYIAGDTSTIFIIPFFGQINVGIFYYIISAFIIIGAVNAVNLTDGIDGLATSITFIGGLGFMVISSLLMIGEMSILSTALCGACLGFLMWNFHPAKIFMGDTGSLFLGGIMVALAYGIGIPFILILVGIIYIIETLSVILQVISFKTTGKRIFKMSPIHHHFEMSGYSEVKIVALFSLIEAIGCILAIVSIIIMY